MDQNGFSLDQKELWRDTIADLEMTVSRPYFESYVKKLTVLSVHESEGGITEITLACPSVFHQKEIEKRLEKEIRESLGRVTGKKIAMELVVDTRGINSEIVDSGPLFTGVDEGEYRPPAQDVGLKKDFTLGNFAVSSSNEMAYAAAKAVANNPGKAYNPLFLYGGVGVGKTHLMQGVGHVILNRRKETTVIYCSGEDFTNEIIDAIRKKSTPGFRKKYRSVELLLIDDIQFIAGKTAVQEEFFHTFNTITQAGGQVILTSDKPPKEIDSLEERLRSRFEGGLSIDIGQPDFELRSAIVMIKARQLGAEVPTEAAQMVAQLESDARTLIGSLMKVIAMSEAQGMQIDKELVMRVLGRELAENRNHSRISPMTIIERVCEEYGVGVEEVKGPRRLKQLTTPRHVAMFLLKSDLNLGLVEIGGWFGGRDHTSVMHAITKVEKWQREKPETREKIDRLRRGWGKG